MARAFVLLHVVPGCLGDVVEELTGLAGVAVVDAVTGPYDVIVTAVGGGALELDRLARRIEELPGVKRMLRCPVPQPHDALVPAP